MRLQYEIAAVGQDQLKAVLRGVEREMMASNRRMMSAVGTSASRAAKQRPSDIARGFGEIAKAAQAADRQQYREKLRNEKAIERARVQTIQRVQREEDRAFQVRARHAQQLARIEVRAIQRGRSSAVTQFDRQQDARRRAMHAVGSGAARTAVGAVGGTLRAGMGLASIGGGFAIASALQEQMAIRAQASTLANAAGKPEIKGVLAEEAQQIRGFTGSEALGALSGFTEKTGDLEAARKILADLGQMSLATGSDLTEMGEAAGQAFNVIRDSITDPEEQLRALRSVMATLAGQGAIGAVEIKDLTTELAGLGAATRKFQGGPERLLATVGAMAQASVARGGASSAAEATTAVSRFATDIIQNESKFTRAGVNVFADESKTQLLDPQEIVTQVLERTGGDLTKITKMFGVFAERAIGGFSPLFLEAERREKGSGRAAVAAEFQRLLDAKVSGDEIETRAASRLDDPDLQFKEVMKEFNARMATDLLPALIEIIPKFKNLIPHIGDAVDALASFINFASRNPYEGIGLIIAAAVAKDVAAAGIGAAASSALTAMLATPAGLAVGTIIAGISLAKLTIDAFSFEANRRFDASESNAAEIRQQAQKELDATGTLSAGTRSKLEQLNKNESARLDAATEKSDEGFFSFIRRGINQVTGGDDNLTRGFAGITDKERNQELLSANMQTQSLLALDEVARKLGPAAEKLEVAAGKLAANTADPARSGVPIAAR